MSKLQLTMAMLVNELHHMLMKCSCRCHKGSLFLWAGGFKVQSGQVVLDNLHCFRQTLTCCQLSYGCEMLLLQIELLGLYVVSSSGGGRCNLLGQG